ncbi:MAG: hypothetical protein OXP12_06065 [Thaumarchaeota archaeon]|nr:hypothetical protein [Nitrososphaerota archaeon]MDE0525964.1 hypothetical protein [Nitrososphaerota archaeon]
MAIITAYTVPEAIGTARRAGLGEVADRLDYLHKLPLENGADPMDPDSARSLVSFLVKHHQELPVPGITMNPEGHVHGDWEFTKDSNVTAQFLPSGDVRFAHASRDADTGFFRARARGTITPDDMFKKIIPLVNDAI